MMVNHVESVMAKNRHCNSLKLRFALRERLGVIGSHGAIINEQLELRAAEFQRTIVFEVSFEQLARMSRRPQRLTQSIFVGTVQRGFAVVAKPKSSPRLIHRIVRLMPDQQDSRAMGYMSIVGDIDEKFVQGFLADPGMKDIDEPRRFKGKIAVDEDFHIDVLKFHESRFASRR